MARQTHRFGDTTTVWLSFCGCIVFALAAVYAAITAETSGDLAMACLAIPLFCWCAIVMIGSRQKRPEDPSP